MEMPAIDGDSPVDKNIYSLLVRFLSTAGPVKSRGKQGRPLSKVKYFLATDSAQVPWGKSEKNPCKGSEIEPETLSLQAVEAQCPG